MSLTLTKKHEIIPVLDTPTDVCINTMRANFIINKKYNKGKNFKYFQTSIYHFFISYPYCIHISNDLINVSNADKREFVIHFEVDGSNKLDHIVVMLNNKKHRIKLEQINETDLFNVDLKHDLALPCSYANFVYLYKLGSEFMGYHLT